MHKNNTVGEFCICMDSREKKSALDERERKRENKRVRETSAGWLVRHVKTKCVRMNIRLQRETKRNEIALGMIFNIFKRSIFEIGHCWPEIRIISDSFYFFDCLKIDATQNVSSTHYIMRAHKHAHTHILSLSLSLSYHYNSYTLSPSLSISYSFLVFRSHTHTRTNTRSHLASEYISWGCACGLRLIHMNLVQLSTK